MDAENPHFRKKVAFSSTTFSIFVQKSGTFSDVKILCRRSEPLALQGIWVFWLLWKKYHFFFRKVRQKVVHCHFAQNTYFIACFMRYRLNYAIYPVILFEIWKVSVLKPVCFYVPNFWPVRKLAFIWLRIGSILSIFSTKKIECRLVPLFSDPVSGFILVSYWSYIGRRLVFFN